MNRPKTLDDDLLVTIDHANIARQSVEAARHCSVQLVLSFRIEQLCERGLGQFRLVLCPVLAGEIELLGNDARDIDGELDLRVLAALHRLSRVDWFTPQDRANPAFAQLGKARKRGKALDAKASARSPLPLNALC